MCGVSECVREASRVEIVVHWGLPCGEKKKLFVVLFQHVFVILRARVMQLNGIINLKQLV